jgi:hypothetical protein
MQGRAESLPQRGVPSESFIDSLIDPEVVKTLVASFLESQETQNPQPETDTGPKRFKMFTIEAGSEWSDIARYVEYVEFDRRFGNSGELMDAEYRPYDPYSVFIVAIDTVENMPAGVLRVIKGNHDVGIKTFVDVGSKDLPWNADMQGKLAEHIEQDGGEFDPSKVLDIGTLAVAPEYRHDGGKAASISLALYHGVIRFTIDNGFKDWVMLIDKQAYEVIQMFYSNPIETIEGLGWKPYLDSNETIPGFVRVDLLEQRIKAKDPGLYGVAFEGNLGRHVDATQLGAVVLTAANS